MKDLKKNFNAFNCKFLILYNNFKNMNFQY